MRQMNVKRKRWLYLALFCAVNLFAGSLYVWSVFSGPLAARLAAAGGAPVTAADLGLVFSAACAVNPLAMIAGGWVNDRWGPRAAIPIGGVLIGSGMALAGVAESFTALLLAYGVVFGAGVGCVYTSTMGSAIKYFPDKRGLAGGLSTMSYGLSSIVLPPVAGALIAAFGVGETLVVLGCVLGGLIVLCGLLTRRCPDDIAARVSAVAGRRGAAAASRADLDWKQMLRTPIFWVMLLFFLTGGTGALMLISSASAIAQSQIGMGAGAAALVVSLIALMNAAGRLSAGLASDRIGRMPTLLACIGLSVAGLLLLLASGAGDAARFMAGVSLVALCCGGFVAIYPGFTVDQFGARNNSVNYGVMAVGFQAGGVIGPMILRATSTPGNYAGAYEAALVLSALGAAAGLLCMKLQRKSKSA